MYTYAKISANREMLPLAYWANLVRWNGIPVTHCVFYLRDRRERRKERASGQRTQGEREGRKERGEREERPTKGGYLTQPFLSASYFTLSLTHSRARVRWS